MGTRDRERQEKQKDSETDGPKRRELQSFTFSCQQRNGETEQTTGNRNMTKALLSRLTKTVTHTHSHHTGLHSPSLWSCSLEMCGCSAPAHSCRERQRRARGSFPLPRTPLSGTASGRVESSSLGEP